MDDLVAFLRERLDEDEMWARGASRPYPYADAGSVAPEGGVHWTWVVGEDWDPVRPNPAIDEFVAEPGDSCNLATVEEWPKTYQYSVCVRMMRLVYANSIVEMDAAAAGHIARHDPARVLADVAAKRAIIELHDVVVKRSGVYCPQCGGRDWDLDEVNPMSAGGCNTLRLLALPYADHPSYRSEWRL